MKKSTARSRSRINPEQQARWASLRRNTANSLRRLGQVAAEENAKLYLVGGLIRDRLLGHRSLDIDLACDGPVRKYAARLAMELGVHFHFHPAFKTAHMEGPKGTRIDIAMTRMESYPEPGELPKVRKAGIAKDLYRRDFTINAMAQALHPDEYGKVIDPLDGQADLKKGVIRIIHDGSFTDDPPASSGLFGMSRGLGER